jgi:NADPH2:quinone reductase
METNLLKMMQAVQFDPASRSLVVRSIPVPEPGPGQVVVCMAAAPINPSDLNVLRNVSGSGTVGPVSAGYEGSGTVVAAGPGILPRLWMGRRVVVGVPSRGTWAEYVVTSAASCFPLDKHLSFEEGATLIVNPMTALAFFDIARRGHDRALINNAASSAVGRMVLRLAQKYRMPVIHVVRRQEQVELLRSIGAEYILNSRDQDFYEHLCSLAHELKATLILDPVGGEQTQRLLDAAPSGSTAVVYGFLSGTRMEGLPSAANLDHQRMIGFYLPDWMAQKNILEIVNDMRRVQRLAKHELQTTIQKRLPLSAVQQAIELYQRNPTAGKVLLVADPAKVPVDAA